MDITPLIPAGRQIVDAYAPGRFRISGTLYEGSVIVFPDRTLIWPVGAMDSVSTETLAPVFDAIPPVEVLLLGAGAQIQMAPAGLRASLRAQGIGFDLMDTGAACRTYNVLLAEERRVAAALIALPL